MPEVCESCAGWGDHSDCECEYDPKEVIRGGQCPWCDAGEDCKASDSGMKCPHKVKKALFQKSWDLLKIGYIPNDAKDRDVQNPQDIDLPPDHPALNPRPADSISDMSMAHRNAGDANSLIGDILSTDKGDLQFPIAALASMVDEVRMLVQHENVHPMEATRMVADANYPDNRKVGRMLFDAYVKSMS